MLELDQKASLKRIYDRVVNELFDAVLDENVSFNKQQVNDLCTRLILVLEQSYLRS